MRKTPDPQQQQQTKSYPVAGTGLTTSSVEIFYLALKHTHVTKPGLKFSENYVPPYYGDGD